VELQDYLRVVRKRWTLIVLVALSTVGLAAAYTLLSGKTYESTTEFFVSTSNAQDTGQLAQGNTFIQQRVKSYSQLVSTPKVLGPVISGLGLSETPEELARVVTATVPLDTVLIDVSVTDHDPGRAAAITSAIGKQLPLAVSELESVSADQPSPVKVTVVQTPTVATAPISPKPARNIALAIVLGLLLGVGAAVVRDLLDTTIKGARDLEDVTKEAVIGTITFDPDAPAHPLIVHVDSRSQRAEAFRSLRTNLQFVDAANHPRSMIVTSSLPGEGKTTTTANLALTLAAGGSRVCVIEGDLRRPRLLDYLGYEGAVGLTDLLIGRAELQDVLQQFGDSPLWILGAGGIPPNPSELLGSPVMANTIRAIEARFDYVLIDAPPLIPVTDAAVLSTHVGGVVVVVGAGAVQKDHLSRALDTLDAVNANVLGIVLNKLPRAESGGYGAYSYDYSDSPRPKKARVTSEARPKRGASDGRMPASPPAPAASQERGPRDPENALR